MNFVCRTNSQLQVLSSFQCNVQISCILLHRSIYEMEYLQCSYYKMPWTTCNLSWGRYLRANQIEIIHTAFVHQPKKLFVVVFRPRSHYQCVYFHLHLSFFFVFNIFPGCQHYHSCSKKNICIPWTSYNLMPSPVFFFSLSVCVFGSNI